MASHIFALLLLFLSICCEASGGTRLSKLSTHLSTGGKAKCHSGLIKVPLKANHLKIIWEGPRSPMELAQLLQEFRWVEPAVFAKLTAGERFEIEGSYDIFVRLCVSVDTEAKDLQTVQLLTHGATLSHNYWDMAEGYSHVDAAASAGYATLSYDRIGVGLSDHPDPVHEVQTGATLEVMHALVGMLRNGLHGYSFKNVVGVGHSSGSWYTLGAASKWPADFDALVLTGVSPDFSNDRVTHSALHFTIANTDPSGRFKKLPNQYFVQADHPSIHQFVLYNYPHFSEHVMRSQHETRQTVTIGELSTLYEVQVPSTWSGPLDIVNGENDFLYCTGRCMSGKDVTASLAHEIFPEVGKNFQTFNLPNAGHNLAGHNGTEAAYSHIADFLKSHGLVGLVENHSEL